MKKKILNGIWNADRLWRELISLSRWNWSIRNLDIASNTPNGIRIRRCVAVMKAYGKEKGAQSGLECIVSSACAEDKITELNQLILQNLNDEHYARLVRNSNLADDVRERQSLFDLLFKYRRMLYEIEHAWSGIWECTESEIPVFKATDKLYKEHIKYVTDTVQRMLILLMGDDYDHSFTEQELLQFGYPEITDDELQDMILDNL